MPSSRAARSMVTSISTPRSRMADSPRGSRRLTPPGLRPTGCIRAPRAINAWERRPTWPCSRADALTQSSVERVEQLSIAVLVIAREAVFAGAQRRLKALDDRRIIQMRCAAAVVQLLDVLRVQILLELPLHRHHER